MSLSREIRDGYRYFFQLSRKQKSVLFYSEAGSYYAYLEGAVEELLARGESVCYVTSDPDDPIFEKESELLTPLYQRTLLPYFMLLLDSPVCVMTLTELHKHHLKRSVKDVKYVYLFHAMMSTHMIYREGSFDHYDCLVCATKNQIEEVRARESRAGLPKKDLVEGGYYRLERIALAYENRVSSTTLKKKILIAPSWGAKNILNTHADELIGELLGAGYSVVFRAHPESIKREAKLLNAMAARFDSNLDFRLERSVAGDESLLESDVLITDWSGIALEYAFGTLRPVLFLDLPRKIKNSNYQSLGLEPIEVALREKIGRVVEHVSQAPDAIASLLSRPKEYRQALESLRSEYVFAFREASGVAADTIQGYLERSKVT